MYRHEISKSHEDKHVQDTLSGTIKALDGSTHHGIPQRNDDILRWVNPEGPNQHPTDEVWKPADVESQDHE
jgi:hypothetical protein